MSGTSLPTFYWDTCIYLAKLLGEQVHGKAHIDAMTQIAADNFHHKNNIITSVLTVTEILRSKLDQDQRDLLSKMFQCYCHTRHEVSLRVAQKANAFIENTLSETGKVLRTPDAIHLATASIYAADEFHTFDDGKKDNKTKYTGLLELNGKRCVEGLKICKPMAIQGLLSIPPQTPISN